MESAPGCIQTTQNSILQAKYTKLEIMRSTPRSIHWRVEARLAAWDVKVFQSMKNTWPLLTSHGPSAFQNSSQATHGTQN